MEMWVRIYGIWLIIRTPARATQFVSFTFYKDCDLYLIYGIYFKMSIPKYQTAATIERPRPGAKLDLRHDIPVPEPKAGEVLVKLECTGFWYLF